MADKKFYTHIDLNGQEVKNYLKEQVAADPASPAEGREWANTTDNKRRTVAGGTTETYAFESYVLDQINSLGRSQGAFDANPGALPVAGDKTQGDLTALVAGDFFIVSNAGTITGIQGADELSIGDKLQYIGGTPTDPANWIGVQTNLNDSDLGGVKPDRQTVNLVAATPLVVSTAVFADIHSIHTYNSTGEEIVVCVEKTANPNERRLTSNLTLSGVVVDLLGE